MSTKIIYIQPYLTEGRNPSPDKLPAQVPQTATIASRLKQTRLERGIGQAELAFHSDLQRKSIIRYEQGTGVPSGRSLKALAQVLDVSADYLLGLCDTPHPAYSRVENLSSRERELLHILRRAPTLEMQARLINFLQALVNDVPQDPS